MIIRRLFRKIIQTLHNDWRQPCAFPHILSDMSPSSKLARARARTLTRALLGRRGAGGWSGWLLFAPILLLYFSKGSCKSVAVARLGRFESSSCYSSFNELFDLICTRTHIYCLDVCLSIYLSTPKRKGKRKPEHNNGESASGQIRSQCYGLALLSHRN